MIHELEVFGPVATVVPYRDKQEAFALARRGGGSLAARYSAPTRRFSPRRQLRWEQPTAGDADRSCRSATVIPDMESCCRRCMHGGPGRAGGGEELGGLHGLWFYHQRVAMQGSTATLTAISEKAADPRD